MKKRTLSIFLCAIMAFSCVSFAGCEDKKPVIPAEKPVIELNTEEKEITTNYVKSYELPTAECKSKVDKKKLLVTVTATTEAGAAVKVEDGYLKPTALGKHIIRYNATDKDAAKTKADEKTINIIFNDSGVTITPKSNISSFTTINTFTKYVIPAFTDVASVSYDLHNFVDADFNSVSTATFTAIGATEKQPITDVTVAKRYGMGTIEVNYTLTAKTDSKITATHKLDVVVGDVLFNELKQHNDGSPAVITKEEVPEIKAEGYVIKIKSPAWGGGKLSGPSDVLSALNESQDNALVINAYNPTKYWARYFFEVYDDIEYTGIKGKFGNKYIVAPQEHFQIIIPKGMHVGEVAIFDLAIQADEYKGTALVGDAVQERDGSFPASEIYLISTEVISEKTQADKATVTNIWENNAIPTTLGVYTEQHGLIAAEGYALEKFARAANEAENITALDGLKITKTAGENKGYLDFLSDPLKAQTIKDKFAETRLSNYGNYFAYTAHNLTAKEQKIWVMLGYQSNAQQLDKGANWLYELTVPANGSREVYMSASSREEAGHRTPFEVVRLSLDATCDLVINNVRIVNYKNFDGNPIEPFKMELKDTIKEAQITGTSFTVPAFDAAYATNLSATGVITSLKYRNSVEAVGVDKPFNAAIILETGFYDITYTVTETATNKVYTKVLTITAAAEFEATEKLPTEIAELKRTTDYQTYSIPTFDSVFNCIAAHTSAVTKVEFKSDAANSDFVDITSDATKVSVKGRVGSYKITYTVTQDVVGATKTAEFIVTSNSIVQTMFSVAAGATKTNITEGGKHSIKVDNPAEWGEGIYDKSSVIFNDYNNAGDDAILVIKGKYLGATTVRGVFCLGQVANTHVSHTQLWLSKDEDFTFSLPKKYFGKIKSIKLEFAAAATSVEITEAYIAKEQDVSVSLYDLSTDNGAATATLFQDAACGNLTKNSTVTFVKNTDETKNGSLNISTTEATTNFMNFVIGSDKAKIDSKLFSTNAAGNWYAFDVTNSSDKDLAFWIHLGQGSETSTLMNDWFGVPANSTKTCYISRSVLDSGKITLEKDNAALDVLYLKNSVNSGSLNYSNFRILNVANIA